MRTSALSIVLPVLILSACAPEQEQTATPAADTSHVARNASSGLPDPWQMRLDDADAAPATLEFTTMSPGWHITTGPAGIFWQEGMTESGDYTVSTTMHLFPSSGHHEAYGLFVGGKNLNADNQEYLYFVVRGDGQFLIKHRAGAETHVISDWTPHAAIVQKREEAGESVQNVLSVAVAGDAATFSVNGQQVATLPRSQFDLDGQVGLRINHNLNLHVTDIGRPSF